MKTGPHGSLLLDGDDMRRLLDVLSDPSVDPRDALLVTTLQQAREYAGRHHDAAVMLYIIVDAGGHQWNTPERGH